MRTLSLNGAWQVRSLTPALAPSQAELGQWRPATVPGGIHTDLLDAHVVPDPFVADNEKRVAWVADNDWEYRRDFDVDDALLLTASELKAQHKISVADSWILATAIACHATLVHKDPEFEALSDRVIMKRLPYKK